MLKLLPTAATLLLLLLYAQHQATNDQVDQSLKDEDNHDPKLDDSSNNKDKNPDDKLSPCEKERAEWNTLQRHNESRAAIDHSTELLAAAIPV